MAKRVAVIGAGPGGLAAARHFSTPDSQFECQVFEQDCDLACSWRVSEQIGMDSKGRLVHSSMYKNLRTNLPKHVMCYPEIPFDEDLSEFMTSDEVLDYFHKFADRFDLKKLIKFNHLVTEVKPVNPGQSDTSWLIKYGNLIDGLYSQEEFDAVIVANGHTTKPHWPKFDGLSTYRRNILHSHDFRDAANYKDESVLIIGGSFSAVDITMHVSKHAKTVALSHHVEKIKANFRSNVKQVSDVLKFETDLVHFQDGNVLEFDTVIVCTGFEYSFPFLHPDCKITTDGYGVEPLYKHIINIEYPTMCFLILGNQVSPMQLGDLEARFCKKFLSNEKVLPSKLEMYQDLRNDQEMRQNKLGLGPRNAHKFGCLQKAHYDDLSGTAGIAGIDPEIARYILQASEDLCVLSSESNN
ncbi:Hypothetical predicted protein [Cloeon dipterum]|uniref:Flavin-containing monooxygenase n=1 Tax=Cloeon dipterum TaxID=197152 RepID=A0A8S1E4U6_9INSE|nr:Hypothetical predicted protein [Cloeon dipterum]